VTADVKRTMGPITASARVAAILGQMRTAHAVTSPPTLDVDRLIDVELAVNHRFADDMLAVFASGIPLLQQEYDLRLAQVVGHTGTLRALGIRGDRIGVGATGGGVFYCVEKCSRARTEAVLIELDSERGSSVEHDLAQWLASRAPGFVEPQPVTQFAPQLTRKPLESSRSGRKVRHQLFGEGLVLSETGTGPDRTVKADFPGLGLKVLKARFISYVD
jgi:hypothetical protein